MILNVKINGNTYHQEVTARMCRKAYEARVAYIKAMESRHGNKAKDEISGEMMDELAKWLVDAFRGQFTAEEFWDGYSGSFNDINLMMEEIVTAVHDQMVSFPKPNPEAEAK